MVLFRWILLAQRNIRTTTEVDPQTHQKAEEEKTLVLPALVTKKVKKSYNFTQESVLLL